MTGDKAQLRAAIRAQMHALTKAQREESDTKLFSRFLMLPEVERAEHILLYYGVGQEPDTVRLIGSLLDRGKVVALPRCLPNGGMEARRVERETVLTGCFHGIPEPGEECPCLLKMKLDFILTPGLAFDAACRRLGQGGGYYDRYLEHFFGQTVALCRDIFLLEAVPAGPQDHPVGLVLTESHLYGSEKGLPLREAEGAKGGSFRTRLPRM